MTVSDNTKQAEGLGFLSNFWERFLLKLVQIYQLVYLKNPGRALEKISNSATAVATKSAKAALSSITEVISFYHTDRGLYLGKIV